jgi:hypothetical protein
VITRRKNMEEENGPFQMGVIKSNKIGQIPLFHGNLSLNLFADFMQN